MRPGSWVQQVLGGNQVQEQNVASKGHRHKQQPPRSQAHREGVKEDLPVAPEMGTQEQATPQAASRPSALGKFCSKGPNLRPRPPSSGDWYSVKSVGTRTHVQTTEFQIRAWLRGLVLATLCASPECLGVNPRAHKILLRTCLSSHIADLFPGRQGSSGFPSHILRILHASPWFPLPAFHSLPSQQSGTESPPHSCQLLHIWPFLLDPGGWRPRHLILLDSKTRLSNGFQERVS